MPKMVLAWSFAVVLVAVAAAYLAIQVSPWPAALFFRTVMDRSGIATAQALEQHVPAGVTALLDERYDAADADARLDVFYPTAAHGTDRRLATVVWVHGGGFLSGSKEQVANYLKILSGAGFTTVGVDYSLAPGSTYPTPIRQVNAALAYAEANAARFHVDPSKFFLAGDSAGAQIAAQLANVIGMPQYAHEMGVVPSIARRQLRGALLHCGVYDPGQFKYEGLSGFFLRTVIWSYFSTRDLSANPRRDQFSVVRNVSAAFPPMFISVGNADPLAPQSRRLADAAAGYGVPVDRLFFADDHTPPLPHEYQFNLDTEAAQTAVTRSVAFLKRNSR
jgi:acetyl esterase